MKFPKRGRIRRLLSDTRGLTTVEYVIVLAMIAVMSVGLWKKFGGKIHDYLDKSNTTIETEMKGVAG